MINLLVYIVLGISRYTEPTGCVCVTSTVYTHVYPAADGDWLRRAVWVAGGAGSLCGPRWEETVTRTGWWNASEMISSAVSLRTGVLCGSATEVRV